MCLPPDLESANARNLRVKYSYAYKDSRGTRHEAVIEAVSRDAAFAALREQGIRPIKVTAEDGSKANGSETPKRRIGMRIAFVATALLVGAAAYYAARVAGAPDVVVTPQGPVTFTIAAPLPRQRIPGDRERIEHPPTNLFASVGEFFLARYAEPGRPVDSVAIAKPESLFTRDMLKASIRVSSNDLTEHVDLKRIVAGMKREMCAYIEGGGSVRQYLTELANRQRLETSYRDKASRRLAELMAEMNGAKPDSSARAYEFWLKTNAQLQSMGIYPLELPDELRAYQLTLDFEE